MKNKIFEILDDLDVEYQNFEHKAVFTCDDCKGIDIPGKRVKSLLLRNKKASNFYMVVLGEEKQLDTKLISSYFEDNRMSFASEERMMNKIGVKPGHVSPFALIKNIEKDIKVVFDSKLKNELIGFHPGQNDNTTVLKMEDIEKYLEKLGFSYYYLDL